jgi:hypothetical protein
MEFPHPVPSIATQYIRNCKQHDATARQWIEIYARLKSPPLPPVAVEAPSSPKFTKAKGNKHADSGPSHTAASSCSTTRPTRTTVGHPLPPLRPPHLLKAILFPSTRMQELRMEKSKKRLRKGSEVKRIQRPPQSGTPMWWPIYWIRWKREDAW